MCSYIIWNQSYYERNECLDGQVKKKKKGNVDSISNIFSVRVIRNVGRWQRGIRLVCYFCALILYMTALKNDKTAVRYWSANNDGGNMCTTVKNKRRYRLACLLHVFYIYNYLKIKCQTHWDNTKIITTTSDGWDDIKNWCLMYYITWWWMSTEENFSPWSPTTTMIPP